MAQKLTQAGELEIRIKRQLRADVTLLALAQKHAHPIQNEIERSMQIVRLDRRNRKSRIKALREAMQKRITGIHIADAASRNSLTRRSGKVRLTARRGLWPGLNWRKVFQC